MKSEIDKYRKQASYSRGVRKVSALASLARALAGVKLDEASETAHRAVSLARKLLGGPETGKQAKAQYYLVLAKALYAQAICFRASLKYAEVEAPLLEALHLWERHEAWDEMISALILQIEILRERQDSTGALAKNQLALEMCNQLTLRKFYAELYAEEAVTRVMRDEHELADAAIGNALSQLRYSLEQQRPSILAHISSVLHTLGKTKEALQSVEQAIDFARRFDDTYLLLRLLFDYSAYTFASDPRQDYATPLVEAIELARTTGNRAQESYAHEMYGVYAMRSGEYDRAIREFSQARELNRELGRPQEKMRIAAWLGLVYMELGAEEIGKSDLKEAAGLLQYRPLGEGSTTAYGIILEYAPELLDMEKVVAFFRRSIAESDAKNVDALATQELVLGNALELQDLLEDARLAYRSALHRLRHLHHARLRAHATLALGSIESRMGRPDKGRELLLEALELAASCHEWQTTRKIYAELAAVAEGLEDFREALRYRKLLHANEREIVLRQANVSVEQLLVAENVGQLQDGYEQKRARHRELRKEAEALQQSDTIHALRTDEDNTLVLRILHQIDELTMQTGAFDQAQMQAIITDIDLFIAKSEPPDDNRKDRETANAIEALQQRYPELTATECRVCFAIREGNSNRSIAELLNVSLRAIETYRYRIRKKLDLAKGQDLGEFLLLHT